MPHPDSEAEADADADPVGTMSEAVPVFVEMTNPLEAGLEGIPPSVPLFAGNVGMAPVGFKPPSGPLAEVEAATGVTVTVCSMTRVVVETVTEQASL